VIRAVQVAWKLSHPVSPRSNCRLLDPVTIKINTEPFFWRFVSPPTMETLMRYFFDMHDGDELSVDEVGVECANWEAMRTEAISALPEMAAEELPNGKDRLFWVNVRDETGLCVFSAYLNYSEKKLI